MGCMGGKLAENRTDEGFDNNSIDEPRGLLENITKPEDQASMEKCAIMADGGLCYRVDVNFSVLDQDIGMTLLKNSDQTSMLYNCTKVEESEDGTNKTFHYIFMDGQSNAVLSLTTSSEYPQLNGGAIEFSYSSDGNISGQVMGIKNCGQDCHVMYFKRVSFYTSKIKANSIKINLKNCI